MYKDHIFLVPRVFFIYKFHCICSLPVWHLPTKPRLESWNPKDRADCLPCVSRCMEVLTVKHPTPVTESASGTSGRPGSHQFPRVKRKV